MSAIATADFARYIDAFNGRRYDEMISFYADEVTLDLPAASLRSPDGIRGHYKHLHSRLDEWLRVDWMLMFEDRVAVEIYTEFFARRSYPEFSMKPIKAGELFRCTNMVHYDLDDDGRFSAIRVGRYKVHPGQQSERETVVPRVRSRRTQRR